ncbi:MAG TPA: T9SS type A sorting domain-containing protein [Chitinophagales bacterium]|nr:T9SS type A sorting domain-containing protein [Chitinophagales bacterium]
MKYAFLFLYFLVSGVTAFAQSFAPLGAQWYYSASANGAAPSGAEYYHYQSLLDTTVAGQLCKKITVKYYQYNGSITDRPPVFTYQADDTVWYYNTIYSKFLPLYIFNASQGDTLDYHSPSVPTNAADTLFKVLVDSVTIITAGTTNLQRVWTTPLGEFSLGKSYSELMGSDWLMLHQPSLVFPEWDGPLRCYSDSIIDYSFSSKPCDYLMTNGIAELPNPLEFFVFPNPATIEINIQTNSRKIYQYIIYNSMGQLVNAGDGVSDLETIPVSNFSNGIYSIELSVGDVIQRERFIVMK